MTFPTITIDKDVPQDGTFPTSVTALYDSLMALKPGDSFFFANHTAASVAGVIAYAASRGIRLTARDVTCDSVYFADGVRVWRVDLTTLASQPAAVTEEPLTSATTADPQPVENPVLPESAPAKGDKRKFYVIESDSGNHFAWGSTLPLAEQKLSEERQQGVRLITHQQFLDIENKNFTMYYWINPEERRYFYVCSALNTNASFNLVGCQAVDYPAYLAFKQYVDAGFIPGQTTQYVRRIKQGDMLKLDVGDWLPERFKQAIGLYESVTKDEFDAWEAENEL